MAMNGEPLRRTVIISNLQGLHMRPITVFVEMACKFQSQVFVSKGQNQRINGKSALGLLSLAAERGTELTLEISGPDEQQALEALVSLLNNLAVEEDALESMPDEGCRMEERG